MADVSALQDRRWPQYQTPQTSAALQLLLHAEATSFEVCPVPQQFMGQQKSTGCGLQRCEVQNFSAEGVLGETPT